jgi:hypothetical protein
MYESHFFHFLSPPHKFTHTVIITDQLGLVSLLHQNGVMLKWLELPNTSGGVGGRS